MQQRAVILSAFQDYRTLKRASIQHIADGLVAAGFDVSFISTRFTPLTRYRGDSRTFLLSRANRTEIVKGVRCYLWNTPFHPFATGRAFIDKAMRVLFEVYSRWPNSQVDRIIAEADHVVLESSVAAIYIRRIRKLNPRCRIIYYAADRLDTVGAHPFVQERLEADADQIHHASLRSPQLADSFSWLHPRLYRAGFGIDPEDFSGIAGSPYRHTANAVCVGSMLFDPQIFVQAAEAFPEIQFHVIGCGETFAAPANVTLYPEMAFRDTLPFVKHATVGIAAYKWAPGCEYLADSSLKLAQYEYFGLPAICPRFATGDNAYRFGYEPGDLPSMTQAISAALAAAGSVPKRNFLNWQDVAVRIIDPQNYPDAALE